MSDRVVIFSGILLETSFLPARRTRETEIRPLRSLLLDPKLSPLGKLSTFSGIHLHLGYHIHDCENHKSSIGAISPETLSIGAPHSIHS